MEKLTSKEEEVMELIWKLGSCSPKDVQAEYPEPRPHINTIATMFQSLEKKGYVNHRTAGRGYIYEPQVKKETYGSNKLDAFVSRHFNHSYMNVVSTLVREEKVSEEELEQFLRELKKR